MKITMTMVKLVKMVVGTGYDDDGVEDHDSGSDDIMMVVEMQIVVKM